MDFIVSFYQHYRQFFFSILPFDGRLRVGRWEGLAWKQIYRFWKGAELSIHSFTRLNMQHDNWRIELNFVGNLTGYFRKNMTDRSLRPIAFTSFVFSQRPKAVVFPCSFISLLLAHVYMQKCQSNLAVAVRPGDTHYGKLINSLALVNDFVCHGLVLQMMGDLRNVFGHCSNDMACPPPSAL